MHNSREARSLQRHVCSSFLFFLQRSSAWPGPDDVAVRAYNARFRRLAELPSSGDPEISLCMLHDGEINRFPYHYRSYLFTSSYAHYILFVWGPRAGIIYIYTYTIWAQGSKTIFYFGECCFRQSYFDISALVLIFF